MISERLPSLTDIHLYTIATSLLMQTYWQKLLKLEKNGDLSPNEREKNRGIQTFYESDVNYIKAKFSLDYDYLVLEKFVDFF